jgi:hypothetical protein
MRRTSPWIYVAGVAVQLAALGLCVWAMEPWLGADAAAASAEPGGAPLFDVAADVAESADNMTSAGSEPSPVASEPVPPPPSPRPPMPPPPPAVPHAAPTPLFGPPPAPAEAQAEVPAFVAEGGDEGTQVLRGQVGEGSLVIAIAADGNVRCVDVDGGRYSGRSESARALLREVGGSRAFTVQLGVDGAGALRASFTGGPHDGETIALSPLVHGSAS